MSSDDNKNEKDSIPVVGIYLSQEQLEEIIKEVKGLSKEEIEEVLDARGNLTKAEITAIKKAVHEEARAEKAAFITEKREAIQRWGLPAAALYWAKEQVPDYNLTSFFIRNVVFTTVASLGVAITANVVMDQMNRTEMGEIKATSPETTINSGTYSSEIGQGPYVFIGNALSEGMANEGAIGYGYNNPGGAAYNYFTLAEDGNELHLSLVEPTVVEANKNNSPFKSQPDAKMDNYATLIKKVDIEECAWSASHVYTDYADIISDLESGKEISVAWQWNGTGSDFARNTIYSAFLSNYADQIKMVWTQDNVDMLEKLETGAVDLAVFTEAAGTFEGSVTGTLRKTIEADNIKLVDLQPSKLPTKEGEAQASLSYTFKTLSVPTSLGVWDSSPQSSKPLGTMCNEYIGLYGRNPASIDAQGTAMAAQRVHSIARDVDIVEATGYKAFPEVKAKVAAQPK